MERHRFQSVATNSNNRNWNEFSKRQTGIYERVDDVRSEFGRDYTRILHSLAYRRLKHKTQVFFNISNDHVCTRMEHVSHVESVSNTIADFLGLNVELTKAIAMGHDLGHAPFGHQGESVIKSLSEKHLHRNFWHEKNGLHFVDNVELLEDDYRIFRNLNLTYAVRDGIISHCGEVDENGLIPRDTLFDLEHLTGPGLFQPATWEGCVVKIADKIAYLGRDIEDAIRLGFLTKSSLSILEKIARETEARAINTTVIMHNMILDICKNSSLENGIYLSPKYKEQLDRIKIFNYTYIYLNPKFETVKKYSELVITQIFEALISVYKGEYTLLELEKNKTHYPELMGSFAQWLSRYCKIDLSSFAWSSETIGQFENCKIYGTLETEELYIQAILDYISGMTDNYIIKVFNELITF